MKLTKGQGSPATGACWMSAIRYYETGCDTARWSDHPECVSPVIRRLCILLNDQLPSDAERERVIGPHLFTPLGTRGDRALEQRRAFRCADVAVRVWAPRALRRYGFCADAARLETLAPIIDKGTARAGCDATAYAADAAASATSATYTTYAADATAYAAYVAAYTTYAADAADELLALILELCSWSDRPELDHHLTRRVLREACKQE